MVRIRDRLRDLWREGFPPRSPAAYLFAALCIAVASLLRYALDWAEDQRFPFATFYPAILIVTLLGGIGPGAFAALFGVVMMWLGTVPSFAWPSRNQAIYLAVHVVASTLTVWLAESYRRIVRHLRAEQEQSAFLMRELQHRGKNILTVVRAIVNLVLREQQRDADTITTAIAALVAADELLTRSSEQTADLKDIIAAELGPYDARRIAADGQSVVLVPSLARALALIVHELATNAAKYGALSRPEGTLSVSWEIDARRLRIRWVEQGGPTVVPPTRRGFGSRLLERVLNGLNGRVETEFRAEGVVCTISLALPELAQVRSAEGKGQFS